MTPKQQERLFSEGYAVELLKIARGDFATAQVISLSDSARIENAFFMLQQSIEKAIKAVLVKKKIPVPLVHDLGVLLAKLPIGIDAPYGYELNELNQYATVRRYEEGKYCLSKEEFNLVCAKADEMLRWAETI